MIYIVAYDIANNRRWLKVAKILESWGYRIQESVFQLRLDTDSLARVRHLLTSTTTDAEDVIHIYPHLRLLRRPRRHTRCGDSAR